jgi:anti-sigma factor RsiW
MKPDRHEMFEQVIDKTLAGDVSPDEERSLRLHLEACPRCHEYFSAGTRVISGLGGFSFAVDPGLQARVSTALLVRAQQLESRRLSRKRLVWICIIALVLTVVGSFIDLQFGRVAAAFLGVQPTHLRQELISYWIGPSFWLLLLFPMLPALLTPSKNRKGNAL